MYKFLVTETFSKQFRKLDNSIQVMIKKWIDKNLRDCENPHVHGKKLKYNLGDYWRYRIGNYRLIVEIRNQELVIVAIGIEHRRSVYD